MTFPVQKQAIPCKDETCCHKFSQKWGFPIKADFRPNLREAQKIFQIFVKKEGFWGSEKSSGEEGPFPGGGGFTPTLDTF